MRTFALNFAAFVFGWIPGFVALFLLLGWLDRCAAPTGCSRTADDPLYVYLLAGVPLAIGMTLHWAVITTVNVAGRRRRRAFAVAAAPVMLTAVVAGASIRLLFYWPLALSMGVTLLGYTLTMRLGPPDTTIRLRGSA